MWIYMWYICIYTYVYVYTYRHTYMYIHTDNGILLAIKKEQNFVSYNNKDNPGGHYVK